MAQTETTRTLAVALIAFFAGVAGALVTNLAIRGPLGPLRPIASAEAATGVADAVVARRIDLVDNGGRVRAQLAVSNDGGTGLFFFDSAGRNRLVLGTYSKAENEYPTIVLNDSQQHAAGIFRLFGGKETPVVVLKHNGQDRSIFGLNPASTEPFLVRYANNGAKERTFGDF